MHEATLMGQDEAGRVRMFIGSGPTEDIASARLEAMVVSAAIRLTPLPANDEEFVRAA